MKTKKLVDSLFPDQQEYMDLIQELMPEKEQFPQYRNVLPELFPEVFEPTMLISKDRFQYNYTLF